MVHEFFHNSITFCELPSSTPSLVDSARSYLGRGWSVIPLVGKQPSLKSWKEFQGRRPGDAELTRWFGGSDRLHPTGIGIVTGRASNLVVVDCDAPADAAYWEAEFPSPLAVESGGGGVHYYYQAHPEIDVPNRTRILGRRIDVRGEGGYIVAPPSLHASGCRYAWRAAADPLAVALSTVDSAWFDDHQAMADLALPPTTAIKNAVAYIARITAVSGERGHNSTFRAACKLRDAGLSREEAFALLQTWNLTNADPPWSDAELRHKIASAYQEGRG